MESWPTVENADQDIEFMDLLLLGADPLNLQLQDAINSFDNENGVNMPDVTSTTNASLVVDPPIKFVYKSLKQTGSRLQGEKLLNKVLENGTDATCRPTLQTRNAYYFATNHHTELVIEPADNKLQMERVLERLWKIFIPLNAHGTTYKLSLAAFNCSFDVQIAGEKREEKPQGGRPSKRRKIEIETDEHADPLDYLNQLNNNNLTTNLASEHQMDFLVAANVHSEEKNNTNQIEAQPVADNISIVKPNYFNFPYPKKALRIDPTEKLLTIQKQLEHTSVVVIHGVSGVGKTSLAAEYAYDSKNYEYTAWINCHSEKALRKSYDFLQSQLDINVTPIFLWDSTTWKIRNKLQSDKCLVIFDNCNQVSMVDLIYQKYMPINPKGHIIFTTQLPERQWLAEHLRVSHYELKAYDTLQIMDYIFSVLKLPRTTENISDANKLITTYKGFTLLMMFIPKFIRQQELTMHDFITEYEDNYLNSKELDVKSEDIVLKSIIDSLSPKCKFVLRVLSFKPSLPAVIFHCMTQTTYSKFKREILPLINMSLVIIDDDNQRISIGHEIAALYVNRSLDEISLKELLVWMAANPVCLQPKYHSVLMRVINFSLKTEYAMLAQEIDQVVLELCLVSGIRDSFVDILINLNPNEALYWRPGPAPNHKPDLLTLYDRNNDNDLRSSLLIFLSLHEGKENQHHKDKIDDHYNYLINFFGGSHPIVIWIKFYYASCLKETSQAIAMLNECYTYWMAYQDYDPVSVRQLISLAELFLKFDSKQQAHTVIEEILTNSKTNLQATWRLINHDVLASFAREKYVEYQKKLPVIIYRPLIALTDEELLDKLIKNVQNAIRTYSPDFSGTYSITIECGVSMVIWNRLGQKIIALASFEGSKRVNRHANHFVYKGATKKELQGKSTQKIVN